MDGLMKAISQYPNGTPLIVEWPNGCTVSGKIDTIYDSDDDEEPGSENYRVIYVCVFYITDILKHSAGNEKYSKGDLIEISIKDPPLRVLTESGKIIWKLNQSG